MQSLVVSYATLVTVEGLAPEGKPARYSRPCFTVQCRHIFWRSSPSTCFVGYWRYSYRHGRLKYEEAAPSTGNRVNKDHILRFVKEGKQSVKCVNVNKPAPAPPCRSASRCEFCRSGDGRHHCHYREILNSGWHRPRRPLFAAGAKRGPQIRLFSGLKARAPAPLR